MRIRDTVLRAAVIVLTASLSLVLLPIAINVGTGGTAPAFLAPYVAWTWPAIGVLWLILVLTALAEVRSRQRPTISSRSADVPRNRQLLLRSVDTYLSQRVAVSLAARTRVALALDERPQAVVRPYDLFVQPIDSEPRQLPENADIAAVFDELQDSMLILGAPGAGKTTLLTSLARTLADQAATDERTPIPVLIDLASWAGAPSYQKDDHPRDTPLLAGFVRWLLNELRLRYGIPPAVGRSWLLHGHLALLFDGLDEIERQHREKLAGALLDLQKHYTIPKLAVTCRTHDYEQLSQQLILNGAVRIRPLSRQQVLEYFEAVGPELDGARAAIEHDDELWDLVNSPLMLNVLLLAYQDRGPEDVAADDPADVRRDLFDTFIVEVLARRRATRREYGALAAVRALRTLAWRTSNRRGAHTVVPRWPNPGSQDGLIHPHVVYLLHVVGLPALLGGFVAGATLATTAQYGVLAGLTVAVPAVLLSTRWPVARDVISFRSGGRRQFVVLLLGLFLGLSTSVVLLVAALGLIELLPASVIVQGGISSGIVIGLFVAWGIRTLSFPPSWPYEVRPLAYWRLARWALSGGLIGLALAAALGADFTGHDLAVLSGLLFGFGAVGIWPGQTLRSGRLYRVLFDILLCWSGDLPWRRRAFLTYAADRFVLARTAPGEYSFIHLLIRDHLAVCNPDDLAAKVTRRVARSRT
ncbi:NACHT domain-containing protein [Kribbella sp. NPDC056345]|uniref:NACHT domain-containing protein n=1 Tax=Kribbella sp. NPDC056345 TaxID=3345789 RepID=UPI0035E32AA9